MAHTMFAIFPLFALFAGFTNGLSFNAPTLVDFPVDQVVYDTYYDHFVIVSNNTLYFLEIGQNKSDIQFTKIETYPSPIDSVSVNSYGNMCIMTNGTALIYVHNMLFNTIELNTRHYTYGGWLTNYFDLVITATIVDDLKRNYTSTVISYYTYQGQLLSNYTVGYRLWDVLINPANDDMIFDSFLWLEPATYIGVANIARVVVTINTTHEYPSSGLAVLGDFILASDYYHGINVYNMNGTKLYEIPAIGNECIKLFPNQKYIAYNYLKKVNDTYINPIDFIDLKGNHILTVQSIDQIDAGVILFDSAGNMLTYDMGYIQIFYIKSY
jgi:hypothetical protein